ncbi:HAMP domain-containing sensor histidine kinase [Aliiroseovarius sp. KMU-50]|uniref:histidine kinase n=1 Tax=Aliiroseovarius salicola TaxID=3009082 RepID=A0ABT4W2A6_9RHOB|nr:HAMP domain-containing sensor histidine kinase [Aliiroseovarius sp. KMU-50]MDA5094643.1 HAMP domain-containing sensor histidine kinase [Aliiroseovarius sp. KMU-50]
MASAGQSEATENNWYSSERLERQLRDYIAITTKLIWQRQAIFIAATLLAAAYFDPAQAFACYAGVVFTEVLDLTLSRHMNNWKSGSFAQARRFLWWVMINTALSAGAIALFVITIAIQQGSGGHFTPLFFLFAAALFAAMNNHQLVPALVLRLAIYGATFLFIALLDIIRWSPPISSNAWLEFFTVVFVVYFIVDCSFVYLRLYRQGLRQYEALKQEHQRTLVAYELKSQFLSTVSHELRTPLTSIKGSLDLINSNSLGEVPKEIAPVLKIAGKNSVRLANLIDDLLDLQKIETGDMSFDFDTMDVRKLVRESVDASKGYADALGMSLDVELPQEEALIEGDHTRLTQVMENLLSNALKFSPEGSKVKVSVQIDENAVKIAVEDSGIGIPDGAEDKVFGRFSQVDGSDQRKVGGTGLGMSITKGIIDRHKGHIDYESVLGEGTTFLAVFNRVKA